jgi:hypothetical protein
MYTSDVISSATTTAGEVVAVTVVTVVALVVDAAAVGTMVGGPTTVLTLKNGTLQR